MSNKMSKEFRMSAICLKAGVGWALRWLSAVAVALMAVISAWCSPTCAWANDHARPTISGEWWQIAGDPDLGELTSPKQQPVDFAIWQAKDGTWQLWSCIRSTKAGGQTRLFHRWEGHDLHDENWKPMGIAMQADSSLGETEGGLQAPHVIQVNGTYYMFYGDINRICLSKSDDGKKFERVLNEKGQPNLFEGPYYHARDPMVLEHCCLFYCYYMGHAQGRDPQSAIFCRTSADLRRWSEAVMVSGGGSPAKKTDWYGGDSECPFVVKRGGLFYLFRNQVYGEGALNTQYASPNPMDFGVNDDCFLIGELNVAAPEIVEQWHIVAATDLLKAVRSMDAETQGVISRELAPLNESAAALLASDSANDDLRLVALQLQAVSDPGSEVLQAALEDMLSSLHALAVPQSAVELLCSLGSDEANQLLSENWTEFTPVTRGLAFNSLVEQPAWVAAILSRIDSKEMTPTDLDALQRQRLLTHADQAVRERAAETLLSNSNADRQKVVDRYLAEAKLGNAIRGRAKFRVTCASCHKLDGEGYEIGPDLTALTIRTSQALFESILDPNRAIDERYRSYTVLTTDGIARTGLLVGETSISITLAEQ